MGSQRAQGSQREQSAQRESGAQREQSAQRVQGSQREPSSQREPGSQPEQTARGSQAGGEREQSIRTGRESGAERAQGSTGLAQRGTSAPVRGPGAGFGGNPFLMMQQMAEDMDRLFEQFGLGRVGLGLSPSFGAMLGPDSRRGVGRSGRGESTIWSPQVDVIERGDDLVIRADLPGVDRNDVHVEVENDVLTIRGERREEHEENREGFYRSERSYGQFFRALPLPEGVDAEQVQASYRDGVLEVTVPAPKRQEQRTRRIEIR